MNYLAIVLLTLCSLSSLAQQMSYEDFKNDAKTQINLQPEYGNVQKSQVEKDEDAAFIKTVLASDTTMHRGSEHLVSLGFTHLYQGDIETAMRRFNQAWLLDPKNENAYWGYGAIYGTFNDYDAALVQYNKGLAINPNSTKILTDKATIYMMRFQKGGSIDNLKSAIDIFKASYLIDKTNQNTLFKLSICYFLNNDCKAALNYYNDCEKLGGTPVSPDYTKALLEKCGK
jgi:tetratricopeptide (TPR) repeat protein